MALDSKNAWKKNMKILSIPLYTIGICCVLALPLLTSNAQAQEWQKTDNYKLTLTTGYYRSQGDYGQIIDTDITYIPVIAKVKYQDWTAKLTVPYLEISGPGRVVGGGDSAVTTGTTSVVKQTNKGLGDVIASLNRRFKLNKKGTFLNVTGKVKVPTADEDKRLGTGKTDYTFETGITQAYGDAYFIGKVGRTFKGNSQRFDLDDIWRFSGGAGYSITKQTKTGFTYKFRESASGGDHNSQLMLYATHKFNDHWGAQLYASTGFTDGTADESGGFMLSYKF